MLALSCLISLDRRKINIKHTVQTRRIYGHPSHYIVSEALSNKLGMCKDYCTVAGLWYSTLPGLRFLSLLLQSILFTTSVVMLESGRYLYRLVRGACDWFPILHWDTYLFFPPPSPAVPVMVWYTIYNAPYTRGHLKL